MFGRPRPGAEDCNASQREDSDMIGPVASASEIEKRTRWTRPTDNAQDAPETEFEGKM